MGQTTLSHHFSQGKKRWCSSWLAIFKGSSRLRNNQMSGSLLNPQCVGQSWLSWPFHLVEKCFWCGFFLFLISTSAVPQHLPARRSCRTQAARVEHPLPLRWCHLMLCWAPPVPLLQSPWLPCIASSAGVSQLSRSLSSFLAGLGNTCFLQHGISAYNCEGFGGGSSERPAYSYDIKCRYQF